MGLVSFWLWEMKQYVDWVQEKRKETKKKGKRKCQRHKQQGRVLTCYKGQLYR